MESHEMPAGRYYIGDLCYLSDTMWSEICDLTIKGNECGEGKFTLSDGRPFIIFGTAYGDGTYPLRGSRLVSSLSVDSGTIGCICVNDDNLAAFKHGTIVEFEEEFECSSENGLLVFGNVKVETGDGDEDVEELDPELDFDSDFETGSDDE